MLCGEHCPFFAGRKNAGVVVSRKLPRGGLRQFNQLNDLRKSGTKILPTLSLCFLARVSHRKTIRLRNERSPVTPSAPEDALRCCERAHVFLSISAHVRKNPIPTERMWVWAPSARSTKIGIVSLDAGVAHNTLKVLNQLWRDALGQVGRNVIECSRPKISD